jgi:hypothetical protein
MSSILGDSAIYVRYDDMIRMFPQKDVGRARDRTRCRK